MPEGDPDGVVYAGMQDWSGQIIIIPRERVQEFDGSDELSCPGVYILVGENQSDFSMEYVYVGETESLKTRIRQHLSAKNKTFWKKIIILKSASGLLNKAHIKSLESRILLDMSVAKSVVLVNQNVNLTQPHLALHDKISVDVYLSRMKVIFRSLGINYFNLRSALGFNNIISENPTVLDYSNPIFECKTVGVSALGRMVGRDFVIAKGSTLRYVAKGPHGNHVRQLMKGGLLGGLGSNIYTFKRDVAFGSHSMAASIIAGTQRTGGTTWKIIGTRISFNQWEIEMNEVFGYQFSY